jgi:hypothetical protein
VVEVGKILTMVVILEDLEVVEVLDHLLVFLEVQEILLHLVRLKDNQVVMELAVYQQLIDHKVVEVVLVVLEVMLQVDQGDLVELECLI